LDKVLTKKILIAEGIPTPRFHVCEPDRLWQVDLQYPLIVKLRSEGSSKGLSDQSLVHTPEELSRQVAWLTTTYPHASVFIEEFIEGQEFTVAIIGNEPPEVYPVVQVALDGQTDLGKKFFTFAYLRAGADYVCPAPIPDTLARSLQELARRTYQAVECRDFGRVDFRVDRAGRPYVLEINPLPSLSTEDVFAVLAKTLGVSHAQIIVKILEAALLRLGLSPRGHEARTLSPTPSR
jgi:D-alanine-D-alanine ligase